MSHSGAGIRYRRLRAPRQPGGVLIEPSLNSAGSLLAANRAQFERAVLQFHGRSLQELSRAARAELARTAHEHTAAYRDPGPLPSAHLPFLLSGHQPDLFHPGVWFKNFALSQIARKFQATAIHVLIDNDAVRTNTLRAPTLADSEARNAFVPWDIPADGIPYEERFIQDESCFASFGQRVAETIRPWIANPLVSELWPHAVQAARRGANFGESVSAARHFFESRWGMQTLEVPLSVLCRSEPFRWFAISLLTDLVPLRGAYNEALADYRHVHRLRSHSHPVPELTEDGDWIEAPFWIWTKEDRRRRPVFVRFQPGIMELTDRRGHTLRGALPGGDLSSWVEQLNQAEASGVKLRPRALVTTLYARLILSDLFLHGIGGAKYDQVTDKILLRYFGVQPPTYLTLTATFHLPIDIEQVTAADLRHMDRQLRELDYHPERYVSGSEGHESESGVTAVRLAALLQQKRNWIAQSLPRGQRRGRHQAIESINSELRAIVASSRSALVARRPALVRAVARQELLTSREYSYCLYPENFLCSQLLDLSAAEP